MNICTANTAQCVTWLLAASGFIHGWMLRWQYRSNGGGNHCMAKVGLHHYPVIDKVDEDHYKLHEISYGTQVVPANKISRIDGIDSTVI